MARSFWCSAAAHHKFSLWMLLLCASRKHLSHILAMPVSSTNFFAGEKPALTLLTSIIYPPTIIIFGHPVKKKSRSWDLLVHYIVTVMEIRTTP